MAAERMRGSALRVLRLWRLYAYMDLAWMARSLRLLFTGYLSDAILAAGKVSATLLLAARFDGLGAWRRDQVLFMLGYATLATGSLNLFFNYNVASISRRLGRGQLDHTLIQPQPLWMAFLTEGFMPFSGSAMPLVGLGLMVWTGVRLRVALTPGWLALLLVDLAASMAVVLSFTFLWGSLAFWAPRGAEEISSSAVQILQGLMSFPLEGFGPALMGGLLTVVPSGFVAWYPCRFLLGLERRPWAGAVTPLAAVAMVAAAAWAFGKGMVHYGRTGSQRYSAFGHRS